MKELHLEINEMVDIFFQGKKVARGFVSLVQCDRDKIPEDPRDLKEYGDVRFTMKLIERYVGG